MPLPQPLSSFTAADMAHDYHSPLVQYMHSPSGEHHLKSKMCAGVCRMRNCAYGKAVLQAF